MADALTGIANLITSPPGQLAAGALLAGIVWKFFERVEEVLNEDTKLEIAVWLVGVNPVSLRVDPWPETFAKVFDRFFGTDHFFWRCLWRSCVATTVTLLVSTGLILLIDGEWRLGLFSLWKVQVPVNIVPDYLSLLSTHWFIARTRRVSSLFGVFPVLGLAAVVSSAIAIGAASLGSRIDSPINPDSAAAG